MASEFGAFKVDDEFVRWWIRNDGKPIPRRYAHAMVRAIQSGLLTANQDENTVDPTEKGLRIFGQEWERKSCQQSIPTEFSVAYVVNPKS